MNYDQLPAQLQQALSSHNPPLDTPEKLRRYRESGNAWTDISGVGEQYAQLLKQVTAMEAATEGEVETKETSEDDRPKIFISHKHYEDVDIPIADLLTKFFQRYTANRVRVFQSSNAVAGVPAGESITDELRRQVQDAEVVLLVYTNPKYDWSYCTWETGIAEGVARMKVIVLQCCGSKPAVYSDRQVIDARDREEVRRFVNEALASPEFMPRYGKALTKYQKDESALNDIANELFDDLVKHMPSDEEDSDWLFWPSVKLALSLESAGKLEQGGDDDDDSEALNCVMDNCKVIEDNEMGPTLRKQNLVDASLARLREIASNRGNADWVDGLAKGVLAASRGDWPEASWHPVKDEYTGGKRVVVMLRREKKPAQGRLIFPVIFPPAP